jgi:hypothetical protein
MLFLGALSAEAQHYDRGYEAVPSSPFIEKGTWSVGGTAKYSQHINDNYNLLVISDINSTGFNLSANPKVMYAIKDNMAVGLEFSYGRTMLDLATADLGVASIEMSAADCYQIQHKYSAYGVFRAYIPFGNSKRVAMFADLHLGGSFKQGKAFNAGGEYVTGTYNEAYTIRLGVDPGFIAFLTDRLAVELNVGVFGVNYSWQNQIHNQVEHGNSQSASAGFMVNLLALGVGISYYFL